MAIFTNWRARRYRMLNRWHAWRVQGAGGQVKGFVSAPEPRTIGSYPRGKQIIAGNYLFAGSLLQAPQQSLWSVTPPDTDYAAELHGFAWLDDLAAVGDAEAREKAQAWLWGWIDAYGKGHGPGWTPDLTGRRLIRWINHALFVLRGQEAEESKAFYLSLERQTLFLHRRWHAASPGLATFEAVTGLIYAAMALEGQEHLADPAIKALARECTLQIDDQGGLPTRNPGELLTVFSLLTWAAAALQDMGRTPPPAHLSAIERIAPTLRSLRHGDGALARFHGGGRGIDGWLEQALAAAQVKPALPDGLAMGYARLSAGRTSVIVDADPPPKGPASLDAHASTLAFELTSGRRPLIVNCGSGASFGPEWRRAGRATPSHSTLCLTGYSSARLGEPEIHTGQELLVEGPRNVPSEISQSPEGMQFEGAHDGYLNSHGLTHARTLSLSPDGRVLKGQDMLLAIEDRDKRQFDAALDAGKLQGIRFDIRFHLHPEVDAAMDLAGAAVSMALKSGEIWIFRPDEGFDLALDDGVYLEMARPNPRGAQQIVISGHATSYATRVRWSLSKAQETAIGVRDVAMDEPYVEEY